MWKLIQCQGGMQSNNFFPAERLTPAPLPMFWEKRDTPCDEKPFSTIQLIAVEFRALCVKYEICGILL